MIRAYLESHGYSLLDEKRRSVETPLAWYRGFVEKFHQYYVYDGSKRRKAQRMRLGMAKTISEDYATLLLNENVKLSGYDALEEDLRRNRFFERGNRLVEWTFALGTGALVEFRSIDGSATIDYIRGDMVYPLRWSGDDVTSCAFGSRMVVTDGAGKPCDGYYVQIHQQVPGGWQIRNVYLDDKGHPVAPPEGIDPEGEVSPVPLFQILRPNTINANQPDSPMGYSIFGAAIDQLKACDIVYDSYVNEYVLGKKRMYVPMSLARSMMQENGTVAPVFDPNDALIYVYEVDESGKQELKPVDMTIRAAEHETGLQRMLDLLSKKCGLGTGRYRFDGSGVRTATEVISENSDLYQSVKRHEKPLERALVEMISALAWLTTGSETVQPEVAFDDSIFEDSGSTIERCITLVGSGLKSKLRAIMEIEHVSEEEARKRLEEITSEGRMTQEAVLDSLAAGEKETVRANA